jgi:hypothetical protein
MVTRSTNGDGLLRSDPVHTPVPAVAETDPWAGWERWLQGHLDIERDVTVEIIGETLGITRADLLKMIEPLQREVAELSGAIGVLKGLGPPPGIRFRGSYDPNADYSTHDIVAKYGSSFVALRDRPGVCPGEHWQLLAGKGERGRAGPSGPRGMTGGRGERAAVIKHWLVDKQNFTASPILSDGTVGAALELRGLFQEFLHQVRSA